MDDAFVDAFIAENKRRMRASYELLCGACACSVSPQHACGTCSGPLLPSHCQQPPLHTAPVPARPRPCAGALDAAGIPHLPASAAMFCWIDLGQWLSPGRTWEAEAELWDAMFEAKVLFTPGAFTPGAGMGVAHAMRRAALTWRLPQLAVTQAPPCCTLQVRRAKRSGRASSGSVGRGCPRVRCPSASRA